MLVNRESLLNVLKCARPGLATRDVVDQTGSYLFRGGRVVTYNDKISVSAPAPLEINGAVPGNELYTLINLLNDIEINISVDKNKLLINNDKRLMAKLLLEPNITLPIDQLPRLDDTGWIDIDEDFIWKMKLALFSVSTNYAKPVLCCVHWYDNKLETTDNLRITQCVIKAQLPEGVKILIPAESASAILKHNPTACKLVDGWLHFKINHGAIFSCRTSEGDFPVISRLLEREFNNTLKFPQHFIKSLEKAMVLADKDSVGDYRVRISIADNVLTLRSIKDVGEFEDRWVARCQGDYSFLINPGFLEAILKYQTNATISEKDHLGLYLLRFEGDGFTHVIAFSNGNEQ